MLGFSEYYDQFIQEKRARQRSHKPHGEELEEGLLRSGAVTKYAAMSRQDGDEAVRRFNSARDILQRKCPKTNKSECDDRLAQALKEIIVGLIHTRNQNGNALASNVAAHLLNSGSDANGRKKRR